MTSFGSARLVALGMLAFACSTGAVAQDLYRCGEGESQQDIKVTKADWFTRASSRPADELTAKGCNSDRKDGEYLSKISCSSNGGTYRATTRISKDGDSGFQIEEIFDTAAMELTVYSPGSRQPDRRRCTLVGAASVQNGVPVPSASSVQGQGLATQIAAGRPFLIVTSPDGIPLKREGWYYPNGQWVVFEGRYHADKGLWAVSGVGFSPQGNPLHSCPKEFRCGGIHEEGFPLARWFRPEDRELVAFGQAFTFDDGGNLFRDGSKVGQLIVPSL